MLTQQKFNKILRFQTLISPNRKSLNINNTIFWKHVTRPFRCIYVNCFNRLRFLAEVSTKLKGITRKGTWKLDRWPHFFHLLFPLYLFVTFISEFENTQNSFSCGLPFGPFWSVKYLNFSPKATDSDSSLYFSRK